MTGDGPLRRVATALSESEELLLRLGTSRADELLEAWRCFFGAEAARFLFGYERRCEPI